MNKSGKIVNRCAHKNQWDEDAEDRANVINDAMSLNKMVSSRMNIH